MDAEEIRKTLQCEYGIGSDDDFYAEEKRTPAIMIGLFTTPLQERRMAKCIKKRKE